QSTGFCKIILSFQNGFFSKAQTFIIFMFHIMGTYKLQSIFQRFVLQKCTGVYTFQKYGRIIFQKVLQQLLAAPTLNDIGLSAQSSEYILISLVIGNFPGINFQLRLSRTIREKTVQMDIKPPSRQSLEFIKNVDIPSVICREGNIKRYDVQVYVIHNFSNIESKVFSSFCQLYSWAGNWHWAFQKGILGDWSILFI